MLLKIKDNRCLNCASLVKDGNDKYFYALQYHIKKGKCPFFKTFKVFQDELRIIAEKEGYISLNAYIYDLIDKTKDNHYKKFLEVEDYD